MHRMLPAETNVRVAARSDSWIAVNTGNGFVIVGADDRLPEVLGWSDNGELVPDSINDNLRYWLSCYDEEWHRFSYGETEASADGATDRVEMSALRLPEEVLPLCQTQWNQGNPFNQKCPEYKSGTRSATGCVATAMAQVMARYKYPSIGVGSNSYNWARAANDTIPLYARFDSVPYNWELILGKLTSANYDSVCDMLSMLMYHCGVSVNMKYGSSSSANTTTAARSLVTYFGYDRSIQNIQCNVLPEDSIGNILHAELAAGRPVIIAGTSEQNTRHAFIADGYNSSGYYHINWGWGGNSDGYYLMSALTPSGQQGVGGGGKTYGKNITFIVGIQPSADNLLPASHLGIDSIKVDEYAYSNGKAYLWGYLDFSPQISVNMIRVQNFGLYNFAGEYGLALMSHHADTLLDILDSRSLTLKSGYFRTGTNNNLREVFSFKASAVDTGIYRLAHVYRDTSMTDWHISYARYSPSFIYMSVRSDSVLLSYNDPSPAPNPHDTSIVVTPTTLEKQRLSSAVLYPACISQGGTITIDIVGTTEAADIEIFNIEGLLCRKYSRVYMPFEFSAPEESGMYVVRLFCRNQAAEGKFIVQ